MQDIIIDDNINRFPSTSVSSIIDDVHTINDIFPICLYNRYYECFLSTDKTVNFTKCANCKFDDEFA